MTSEVEYKGIKLRGGKLLLILPLLGTLGGALWAGFEGYARWVAMEEKIAGYTAPDLSGFTVKLDVLEEKLNSINLHQNNSSQNQDYRYLKGNYPLHVIEGSLGFTFAANGQGTYFCIREQHPCVNAQKGSTVF